MERFKETPQTQEIEEELRIINETLKGKSESELTPEERDAEAKFEQQNLETFLELIDKNKISVHSITDGVKVADVLKTGLLSVHRLDGLGIDHDSDAPFQRRGGGFGTRLLHKFSALYEKFESGQIDEKTFNDEKEALLHEAPAIGRKRVAYFFDKVLPKVEEALKESEKKDEFKEIRFQYGESLGIKPLLKGEKNNMDTKDWRRWLNLNWSDPDPSKEEKFKAMREVSYREIADLMSGEDLISATSAEHMKRGFVNNEKELFQSGHIDWNASIFFEPPSEVRQFDLGELNLGSESPHKGNDVAISNRIPAHSFKAMKIGYYDTVKRTLLMPSATYRDQDLKVLEDAQTHIIFFDHDLTPIPPLHSIKTQIYKDETYEYLGEGREKNGDTKRANEISAANRKTSINKVERIIEEKGYRWGE
jgi:hypothetical protein